MSAPILADVSAFDAIDLHGAVKPPEPEPVPSASPTPVSRTSPDSGDSAAEDDVVEGEAAEDATEDDDDLTDTRLWTKLKDGRFAPHTKKKIVGELRGRLSKLTAKYRETEAELTKLRTAPPAAPAAPSPASAALGTSVESGTKQPKFEDFQREADPLAAWVEAVADWKAERALAKRDEAQTAKERAAAAEREQASLAERVQNYAKDREDFEVVVSNPDLTVSSVIRQVLNTHADGPAMAYYLGTHLDTARELALLTQHTPVDSASLGLVRELLQTRMGTVQAPGAAPAVTRSTAPRPLTPVRTGRSTRDDGGPPDPATSSLDDHFRYYNRKDQERRRRV